MAIGISLRMLMVAGQDGGGTPAGLDAPTDLTATVVSASAVDLAWTDNATTETGYKIERSTDGSAWTQIDTAAANATSYSDTGLSTDTDYHYRVRAYNGEGNGDYSVPAFIRINGLFDSLISYWEMEEASGTRADAFGSNDLTDNNTVPQAVGKIGNAAAFQHGNSEFLSRASNASLQTGDIDFVVWAWTFISSKGANRGIMTKHNGSDNTREYLLYFVDSLDRWQFLVSPDGGATTTSVPANNQGAPVLNTWYLVMAWHDATANTINIQSSMNTVDSAAHTTGLTALGADFNIGATNNGTTLYWNGRIDQAGFAKAVPTEPQRHDLFHEGKGKSLFWTSGWYRRPDNPVLVRNQFLFDTTFIRSPSIIEYDADTWIMFYIANDGAGTADSTITYATAPKSDPHNWTASGAEVLTGLDARGVSALKDGSTWVFLYDDDTNGTINLATGADLENVTASGSNPVLSGTGTDWEQYVRLPSLIKVDTTYHMFYDGRRTSPTGTDGDIGHATSSNLTSWTRDTANNPVLAQGTDTWESDDVGAPNVIDIGGTYYMVYHGYDGRSPDARHSIGLATSADLTTWTKDAGNPILTPDYYGGTPWDEGSVHDPCLFSEDGNLHVYFAAFADAATPDSDIGYATQP